MLGKQAMLVPRDGGTGPVLLAATKDDFAQFFQAATKHDTYGIQGLMRTGQTYTVPAGTNVLVLGAEFSDIILVSQVRVLSGERAGMLGWAEAGTVQAKR